MPTSGITSFSLTARELVGEALAESSIIPAGEDPEPEELNKCIRRLNAMLKTWQMQGVMWKQETVTINGTANISSITLSSDYRGVNAMRYVESATNERQMLRYERDEYSVLPNKTASGTPTIYRVQRTDPIFIDVWPVPDANFTLKADVDVKMDTVTDASQTVDFPEELVETVYSNLAVRCCGLFGKQPDPELYTRAAGLETLMLDNYRPASYYMESEHATL